MDTHFYVISRKTEEHNSLTYTRKQTEESCFSEVISYIVRLVRRKESKAQGQVKVVRKHFLPSFVILCSLVFLKSFSSSIYVEL